MTERELAAIEVNATNPVLLAVCAALREAWAEVRRLRDHLTAAMPRGGADA